MRDITILFGAGAEGKGQLGFPSGAEFKRDIILGENVSRFFNSFITNTDYRMNNRKLLSIGSTSVLYQTIAETSKKAVSPNMYRSEYSKEIALHYYDYKQGQHHGNPKDLYEAFKRLYQEEYYSVISKNNTDFPEYIKVFLEKIGIYSFVDSLFNYLRLPDSYKAECGKLMKVFYSALYSVLYSVYYLAQGEEMPSTFEKAFNAVCEKDHPRMPLQSKYILFLDTLYKNALKRAENADDLYYKIIESTVTSETQAKFHFITTNYTEFAQRIIGIKDGNISYLHGRLDYFEEMKTKRVARINRIKQENIIFPYLLIQSGVKPIISPYQIGEFGKAIRFIGKSEHLFILGYGINPDDEHITNILRERISRRKNLHIHFFVYIKEDIEDAADYEIKKVLGQLSPEKSLKDKHYDLPVTEKLSKSTDITFYSTNDFAKVLEEVCAACEAKG